jgi:hypothetical protein
MIGFLEDSSSTSSEIETELTALCKIPHGWKILSIQTLQRPETLGR